MIRSTETILSVSEAGVMSYYCTRCGILMKTEPISMLDISQVLCDCLGGLPYGSVTLGSDEVQWRRDGEITHNGKGALRLMGYRAEALAFTPAQRHSTVPSFSATQSTR